MVFINFELLQMLFVPGLLLRIRGYVDNMAIDNKSQDLFME